MSWFARWVMPFLPMGLSIIRTALEENTVEAKKQYKAVCKIIYDMGPLIKMIFADDPDFQ